MLLFRLNVVKVNSTHLFFLLLCSTSDAEVVAMIVGQTNIHRHIHMYKYEHVVAAANVDMVTLLLVVAGAACNTCNVWQSQWVNSMCVTIDN